MKRMPAVVAIALGVLALSSCESSKTDDSDKAKLSEEGAIPAPKGGSSTRPVNETAFVFVDRSDPEFEYAYVVSTKGVIAQVSVFPGYTNRQLFAVPHLPEPLAAGAKRWEQVPGEIRPPFIPGGPWFSRTALLVDGDEQGQVRGRLRDELRAERGDLAHRADVALEEDVAAERAISREGAQLGGRSVAREADDEHLAGTRGEVELGEGLHSGRA